MTDYDKYRADLQRQCRKEGHLQRLGDPNPTCCICGYAQPDGLVVVQASKTLLEHHHLAGCHEGLEVWLCRNCHAEFSDLQCDWDPKLRGRQRDDPTRLAGLLHGLAEFFERLARELRKWAQRILQEAWMPNSEEEK